ncbi:MAG: glutamate--tRNA ligase [Porticoccus sp.]|uniref:glutamate--tRNA ligase n=1 Tax=Porticoccus hydrocarbonoclasticus TaxID=1073414 RepID=UPI0005667140|nr:glutamate--tRNA ligase [Porticoccus hydrocarbonoclasticus]MBG58675.1 glutamate--tRNA ligase [Porticoccus sp.]|tara:strand:+ start:3663 stop:5177 length:1515 start_codon:yes stop_codon:yes gene_type:complete
MSVRTRIAPSPTGDPHVGTAYVALFNLCFARSQGGEFILRIEDTDQVRSTPESEKMILDSLRWLGLEWSEGPDVGGPYGPYRQSERTDIYQQHAMELVDKGHAFYCFATSEELDEMRREQVARGETAKYDGRGLSLSAEDVKKRLAAGEPYVIRMKIPDEGSCVFHDLLRGQIEIPWSQVDMQVLLKADGMPTYHLANVVDDHLMKITHVIRGEEWINSAPKHLLLYQYFGWEMPELCHMPLLRNPDKSKLSKRKNPTSINYYRHMGYMPEAVVNYLGRMGWSMPDESEKFGLQDMLDQFDLRAVHLGGPVFDTEKLDWLNGRWIRENLDEQAFANRVAEWAINRDNLARMIPLIKERVEKFSDIAPLLGFMFSGMPKLDTSHFEHKKLDNETVRRILQYSSWRLDGLRHWSRDGLYEELNQLAQGMELKLKDFLSPLFVAVAGSSSAPPLFDAMAILGPDMVRARIRSALEASGGVSKKQLKAWDKDYRLLSAARTEHPEEQA